MARAYRRNFGEPTHGLFEACHALATLGPGTPPALFLSGPAAAKRTLEFFVTQIPNDHTRRAYYGAIRRFSAWCLARHLADLGRVEPVHIAAWLKALEAEGASRPTVKQHLAAVRMLFDGLVVGQIVAHNPAHAVRGPKHVVKKGKTPVLSTEEMHDLVAGFPCHSLVALRDRALLATMAYTFARIGAVLQLKVEDYYVQGRRGWLRLHEKGGKVNELPCHHDILKVDSFRWAEFPHSVAIHNSCSSIRGLGLARPSEIMRPPFNKTEALLSKVKGLVLVPLDRPDDCCGFGGTFCVTDEAVSARMEQSRPAASNDALGTGIGKGRCVHLISLCVTPRRRYQATVQQGAHLTVWRTSYGRFCTCSSG